LVVPEEQAELAARLRRRLSGESLADQGEATILRKNGDRINIEYAVKLVRTADRTQLFAIVRDITERKRAEEDLLRLSSAVRTSVDSVVLTDIAGNMIEVNDATLAMYGTDDKADLLGKSAFELIVPEDREKALAGMGRCWRKVSSEGRSTASPAETAATLP
jgi:PAS domain-containing protein